MKGVNSGIGKIVLTTALAVLFFFAVTAVVSAAPNCTVVVTPDDLLANSTGTFITIINCTDPAGINTSRFIITRTIEGFATPGVPNRWSIRPPVNDKAQSSTWNGYSIPQILRADGRANGKWYDTYGLFGDNYSYAVTGGDSPRVTFTNGSTWAALNFRGR